MQTLEFPENEAYWSAAGDGRLLVKHCNTCGENHHYPRVYCPFCMSADTAWLETSGAGIIYSFTVWRRRDRITIPAFVTLPEGPTIMTELVDVNMEDVRIGMSVRLARPIEGRTAPVFNLVA